MMARTPTEDYNEAFEEGVTFEKKRTQFLLDAMVKAKECLTSGNSVNISDPRPAKKELDRGVEEYEAYRDE